MAQILCKVTQCAGCILANTIGMYVYVHVENHMIRTRKCLFLVEKTNKQTKKTGKKLEYNLKQKDAQVAPSDIYRVQYQTMMHSFCCYKTYATHVQTIFSMHPLHETDDNYWSFHITKKILTPTDQDKNWFLYTVSVQTLFHSEFQRSMLHGFRVREYLICRQILSYLLLLNQS